MDCNTMTLGKVGGGGGGGEIRVRNGKGPVQPRSHTLDGYWKERSWG